MSNKLSNIWITIIFLILSFLLVLFCAWIKNILALPAGFWGVALWICALLSIDIVCMIGYKDYQSVLAFLRSLDVRDNITFWGSFLVATIPLIIYFETATPNNKSALFLVSVVLAILLFYFPVRLFGSTKLKNRFIEKKI